MKVEERIMYIPINGIQRQGVKINPTTYTIHSTANLKSTAINERDNLARKGNVRLASFHDVVDDKMVVRCIPHNEKALHAGNSVGNATSISLEICESGDKNRTINNAIEVVSHDLQNLGWGVDRLRRHYDWSGKNCPRIMSANNWAKWVEFKTCVQIN